MADARWFRPAAPAPDLASVLSCRWDATADGEHDLIPDGCVDLLWIEDRGVWVCGPDTTAWTFTLPSGTKTSGIRIRPGAAGSVFGVPPAALVDEQVHLADVLAPSDEHAVDDEVSAAADGARRTTIMERFLRARLERAEADPMVFAAALLSRSSAVVGRLDDVADEFGLSARHFRRRFSTAVGYSPAFYARIARLQRFLRVAASTPELGLAGLAASAGFTDQAHLARDCRELAGTTPRRLVDSLHRTSSVIPVDGRLDGRSVQDGSAGPARQSVA